MHKLYCVFMIVIVIKYQKHSQECRHFFNIPDASQKLQAFGINI